MQQLPKRSLSIAGILIVIAISSFAYQWGKRSAHNAVSASGFRITGDSMAPTFGDGDFCRIMQPIAPLRIGDIVAVEWAGIRHIKRIAALGGDQVDLDKGRILVNGRRIEDLLADRAEGTFVSPALVQVSSQPDHWSRDTVAATWMIYAHHNPHQADRITPVMDDYPINRSVRRKLNRVDRLVLQVRPITKNPTPHRAANFRVAFFHPHNPQVVTTMTDADGLARFRDATGNGEIMSQGDIDSEPRLDAAHPIAIELDPQQATSISLNVLREIEYRDDKPSGNVDYPLTLNKDELFVVGDNVPVSVDSRTIGPLTRSAVVGRVVMPP